MQFTNHLSPGLRPDLLGELTELGWLDPLPGCGAPREREEGTRMGGGNIGKRSREKGEEKGADGAMEGRQERNGTRRVGGLSPKVGGNLRPSRLQIWER